MAEGKIKEKLTQGRKGRRENQAVPTVAALCDAMETIAPLWSAADWDNVGLLAGARGWPARRVLLTIDFVPDVLDEAIAGKCDAVVSYHPPIYKAIKRLTVHRSEPDGLAAEALANRIAIYSPHTALDCAVGGTNDALAALCGLRRVRPFQSAAPRVEQCKLVTFVPEKDVDTVAEAVFEAGAGRIGDYEKCSYRLSGHGTFFGTDSTSPVVGKKGRLEHVDEIRLEVVFPKRLIARVAAALRKAHPYEEPAFDVYPLQTPPDKRIGQGRIGDLSSATTVKQLAARLARATRAELPGIVGDPRGSVRRALIVAGSAGRIPFEEPEDSPTPDTVVITGEIRHHDALHYDRLGIPAITLGHSVSERPVLRPLGERLRKLLRGVDIVISKADRDPFRKV